MTKTKTKKRNTIKLSILASWYLHVLSFFSDYLISNNDCLLLAVKIKLLVN